jgi:hypothetical protein
VGGQKLTRVRGVDQAVIETRGEGNYFICAPTEGYAAVQGDLTRLPVLSTGERDAFLGAARQLGDLDEKPKVSEAGRAQSVRKPGEDFAARTTWGEILEPHGWTLATLRDGVAQWVRPGKTKAQGIGACSGFGGSESLTVFTTSTVFEPTSYSKFGAFAVLNHGGDMGAAAKALAAEGFGEKREAPLGISESERSTLYISQGAVAVTPDYLIEPYIQKGKMTLLDADGGVGKTGFAMALAACGSRGLFPPVGEVSSFRTLYYGREDEAAELETIYYACSGRPGHLALVPDNFPLNAAGLARVERDILAFRPGLVIFDPLLAFLSGVLANINDALPVNAAMDALAGVFARTGAAGVNLRHTRKSLPGQLASEAGMGSVQFRNRHRSQLVMRFHPDKEQWPRVVAMEHLKGSLLSPMGEPVFFERRGNAVLFVNECSLPTGAGHWEPPVVKKTRGRPNEAIAKARTFLVERIGLSKTTTHNDLKRWSAEEGIAYSTLDRARKDLGIVDEGSGAERVWSLPEPFCDA